MASPCFPRLLPQERTAPSGILPSHVPQLSANPEQHHTEVICQSLSTIKQEKAESFACLWQLTGYQFPKHALCAEPDSWQALVNHYHALGSIFNAL